MFVILVILVNLAGAPVMFGEYAVTTFDTMEACNAGVPAAIIRINDANSPKRVSEANCFSREEANKIRSEIQAKQRKGTI